ncbi:MAG: LLM class flavin-dependent oxidoreductase, partial [Acidobacteriota bacterium]
MKRVALYLQDAHDLRDGLDYVRYAEAKGFEAVWQAESRLVRDAIVPMAAYAAVTDRIKVGSGVINNWTRNIGLLASTFLTLDDLAPNRVICGIGAWWDPLATNVGIHRTKPLNAHAAARAYCVCPIVIRPIQTCRPGVRRCLQRDSEWGKYT